MTKMRIKRLRERYEEIIPMLEEIARDETGHWNFLIMELGISVEKMKDRLRELKHLTTWVG